MIKFCSNPY